MPLLDPGILESRRLLLRRVDTRDLADLGVVNGDDAVTRFLPYATWRTPADASAWFERMQAIQATGTALQLVIVERTSERAIGTCLVFRHDEGSARAELGYVLGRAHWSRGYMREALGVLIANAFGPMKLRRLEAEVDPRNGASQRLLLHLGFQKEGRLRERWIAKGEAKDVDVFGLLRHEWTSADRGSAPAGT